MTDVQVVQLIREGLFVALLVSAPPIGAGLITGVFVSIVQTTFSIQEQTLTFVPKILAMVLTLVFFGQWMLMTVTEYTSKLFTTMFELVK